MNKGLEALKNHKLVLKALGHKNCEEWENLKDIEKELKQAKENEKLLNVFKNALTIEHHEYPTIEHDDSEDVISYLVKELYTIRQSELDKDMRKALKEWVLKNAFPKELKALEIIKCLLFSKCKVYETNEKATATTITKGDYYVVELKLNNERFYIGKEEYDLLKEVLL